METLILMAKEDNFESELASWKQQCNGITVEKSISQCLRQDADPIFFPNV